MDENSPIWSMRYGVFAAFLALALVLPACSAGTGPAPSGSSGSGSGVAAASGALDFSAPTVDGGSFDASTLAGTPVVLWFWAPF